MIPLGGFQPAVIAHDARAAGSIQSGQGNPITASRRTVLLRQPAIERRGATLRQATAVLTVSGEKLGAVEVLLARFGSEVSLIGEGIASVGGSQDLLDGPYTLGDR